MSAVKLIIGNKNYSTWSLRPWLLLKHFNVAFEEIRVPLNQADTTETLGTYSPTYKVPVLIHEDLHVWDSLAICEYISEQFLEDKGWPANDKKRARARSVSAEMHSSFSELRNQWPMNVRLQRTLKVNEALAGDIARIDALWSECLADNEGPWLFGDFSIADCMFAPVAMRFYSYHPQLSAAAANYVESIVAHPMIKEWVEAGIAEKETIKEDEVAWLLGEKEF